MSMPLSCECDHAKVVWPTGAGLPKTTACYSTLNSVLTTTTNMASGAAGVANLEIVSLHSGSGAKVFDALSGLAS